jgi:hypothetical protein
VSLGPRTTLNPDTRLRTMARFGSALLVRELWGIRSHAWTSRLVGRVAKFDPPCTQPRIAVLRRAPGCPACGGH